MARAGRLDQRITLQEKQRTADGIGGFTDALSNIGTTPTVWAKVEPKSGSEDLSEGRMNAVGMYVFTVRTRTDLNESMVILWGGETYNIQAIMRRGERPLYMQIEAMRGKAP